MGDILAPQPAVDPYPTLRLMGEIDWTEGDTEDAPEQIVRRAVDIGRDRARWANDHD